MKLRPEHSFVISGAIFVFIICFVLSAAALADDGQHSRDAQCPPGALSCKIVVMTPEEIQSLTGPNGVFDQAAWASRSTMTGLVDAWKKKIETSPNGIVPPAEKPEGKK